MARTKKNNDVTMNDLQELMLQMMNTMNAMMATQQGNTTATAKKTATKKTTKKSAPKKTTGKTADKTTKNSTWMSKDEFKAQFSEADRMAYGKIAREVRSEMLAEAQVNGYWSPKEYKAEFKARVNARLGKEAK